MPFLSGESDLRNYYDMIVQEQEAKLRPILNKLLPVLCMSVFGAVPDDLDFEFDPVFEPSDQERADLAKCGTDNIVTAYNAGLISQRTALREMKQQSSRTGTWTNITDKEEYALVMHELNTNLSKEQRRRKILYKCIGEYLCTVQNNGFNNYRILGRMKIN